MKDDLDERGDLFFAVANIIWHPDRLDEIVE
jgi:hypothetical protein